MGLTIKGGTMNKGLHAPKAKKKRGFYMGGRKNPKITRAQNCLVVKMPDGDERCISLNMLNFGLRLAEEMKLSSR